MYKWCGWCVDYIRDTDQDHELYCEPGGHWVDEPEDWYEDPRPQTDDHPRY